MSSLLPRQFKVSRNFSAVTFFVFRSSGYIICYNEMSKRVREEVWAGQPDWKMSQMGVSAPVELVKTIVPLCLSRLCLSA